MAQDFPIIEKLGGREAAVAKLRAAGISRATLDAARMWLARGSMPGWAIKGLMLAAEAEGIGYSSADFTAPASAAAADEAA